MSLSRHLLVIVLLSFAAYSADGKSIAATQQAGEDYLQGIIAKLDELKALPIVGEAIGPFAKAAKRAIASLNKLSDGSFGALFNSIMPCRLSSSGLQCEGTVDRESIRSLIKKLLGKVPSDMLPRPLAAAVRLIAEAI